MATRIEEQALARHALAALERRPSRLALPDGSAVELPEAALNGLLELLAAAADGVEAIVVRPARELSTQQAARILNVSRPTVVKLVDDGELVSRKVGSHRRILLADLLAYRDELLASRRAALDQMIADAEELGLYD